jgi:pimeloyl-ACP methyl ester carboxylesterase
MSEKTDSRLRLVTADGERLAGLHLPPLGSGEPGAGTDTFAVVLAPGFSGWSEKPAVRSITADLQLAVPSAGFLVIDLRGHGRSSGLTTFGDREALDVDSAVVAARELGYRRVVTLGWSMGATCVLRHAAFVGDQVHGHQVLSPPDAVATVSAVSRWGVRDTVAMRRLYRMIETRLGRAVARRFFQVRIDPAGWAAPPLSPTEAVARIAVPLLFVHGEKDNYFGWEHAQALAESAGPEAGLWLVEGLGHAEEAAARPDVPGFLEFLGTALREMAAGRPAPRWSGPQIPDLTEGQTR